MKRERRHELEHNALLAWINGVIAVCKPYANLVLGAALAIVIVWAGWTVLARRSGATAGQAWEDLQRALARGSFAEINNVVESYPGSLAAKWARVVLGDFRLGEGCDELFRSRAGAKEELRKAIESYEAALAESSDPAIHQRAKFGLARARESQGELDKAIKEYKKLTAAEGPYQAIARDRITALENPAVRRFCDKFAQFDPKPAFSEQPLAPLDFDKLNPPGPNDLSMPGIGTVGGEEKPATGEKPKPAGPPIELPGASTPPPETPTTPASSGSSTPAPSAETPAPAAPSTPSAKTPAAETPASTPSSSAGEPKKEPLAP
jgi:hypothetical protein